MCQVTYKVRYYPEIPNRKEWEVDKNMKERWYENKVADKATESTVRSLLNSVEEQTQQGDLMRFSR